MESKMNKKGDITHVVVDVDKDGHVTVYTTDRIEACSRYAHKTGDTLWWEPTAPMPNGWMDRDYPPDSIE